MEPVAIGRRIVQWNAKCKLIGGLLTVIEACRQRYKQVTRRDLDE